MTTCTKFHHHKWKVIYPVTGSMVSCERCGRILGKVKDPYFIDHPLFHTMLAEEAKKFIPDA